MKDEINIITEKDVIEQFTEEFGFTSGEKYESLEELYDCFDDDFQEHVPFDLFVKNEFAAFMIKVGEEFYDCYVVPYVEEDGSITIDITYEYSDENLYF